MKKLLLEYVSMFTFTITGLIFGLSFFLLFINFYHMEELAGTVDISAYNANNKTSIESKVAQIRNNISVYEQTSYTGSLNVYGLNNIKSRLENCLEIIESDDMMKYLDLGEIDINDSYNFVLAYRNEILNDCLVMQITSLTNTDSVEVLPNFSLIKPYIELNIDNLLNSYSYIQNNIENSDHYYFTTETNKNNFFNLVEDSYTDTMNNYQSTLDLLVEISNWYRSIVIGG